MLNFSIQFAKPIEFLPECVWFRGVLLELFYSIYFLLLNVIEALFYLSVARSEFLHIYAHPF